MYTGRYYPGPAVDYNLGELGWHTSLGDTPSDGGAALLQQLHQIALQINAAKAAGDTQQVTDLLAQFQQVASDYRAAGDPADQLTTFDQFVLDTGNWVQQSVNALPGAISALPSAIGSGLLQAAIPWAIGFAVYIWLVKGKGRRALG